MNVQKGKRRFIFIGFHHGSRSSASQLDAVKQALHREVVGKCDVNVTTWDCTQNEGFRSDDGIKISGVRMAAALQQRLQLWVSSIDEYEDKEPLDELHCSFVGCSCGGVVLREAVPLVFGEGRPTSLSADLRDRLTLDAFVSVASPHCGVTDTNMIMLLGGSLVAYTFSQTYSDLLLLGSQKALVTRLLSDFHVGVLKRFKRRVLYGNLWGDHMVGFRTATLSYDTELADRTPEEWRAIPSQEGFPHVLSAITIGKGTKHEGSCCSLDEPYLAQQGRASTSKLIASFLRSQMEFTVIPVAPTSFFPTAHDDIIAKGSLMWLSSPMGDVPRHIAMLLVRGEEKSQ